MAEGPEKKNNDEKKAEEKAKPEEAAGESGNAAELKEQLLRLAAEFDNYKKRVKKEIENAQGAGKASLLMDMLPIIDEFELAMLAIGNSEKNRSEGRRDALFKLYGRAEEGGPKGGRNGRHIRPVQA